MLVMRRLSPVLFVVAISLVFSSCLVRRRFIATQKSPTGKARPLITVNREQLVHRLTLQYDAIHSFNATADMTPSLGSVYKGSITEYKDIRAYILFRKPSDIRVIGLYPVVRSKAFDMVSDGKDFRIYLASKNRFIEGANDAPAVSKSSIENLRPETFLDAMLIPPPQEGETALMVDDTDEESSRYILELMGHTPTGELMVNRTIFVDRTTLLVNRQKTYDSGGEILSDTRYSKWKAYDNGAAFPSTIDINRPEDGYGVLMNIVKMEMNSKITN